MFWELFCLFFGAAGILSAILWRKKLYHHEHRMEELTNEIQHFLNYPSKVMQENLHEGKIHNLENQIIRMEEQLLQEIHLQQQREEQTNHFIENMAHQMKTAVTALQIRLDLAQLHSVTEEERTALQKSQACMERLTNEIDRILKSSQLAAGKIQMVFEPLHLADEILSIIQQLRSLTDKRQVSILLDCEKDIILYGDAFWLPQALENIIKNAAEHTRQGGRVWVTAKNCGQAVSIIIEDEGMGIPPEEFPLLFQRFTRGTVSKTGYGIGLSMARDIVETHHGTLTGSNGKTGGACFTMTLPILEGPQTYICLDSSANW
ncbi:MAG: HAMP domain-containing histidine kinase [Eubacterium sp.]|nr:HAMP domain-containing histidine kinase [Eubacterium sp.]